MFTINGFYAVRRRQCREMFSSDLDVIADLSTLLLFLETLKQCENFVVLSLIRVLVERLTKTHDKQ